MDLVLLVDTSSSIADNDPGNIERISNFPINIVKAVDLDDVHVAMVTFSTDVKVEFYLNTFSTEKDYVTAIKRYTYEGGSTRTLAALRAVRDQVLIHEHGDRKGVPNAILLITDGDPTDFGPEIVNETAQMRDEVKIVIVSVVTTEPFDEENVKILASEPPEENFFEVTDYNALSARVEEIIRQTCRPDNDTSVVTLPNCKMFIDRLFVTLINPSEN